MGEPKISVIMPVYNTARYLSESVGGILRQTFADFELICINDGSSDNSLSILRSFAKRDKRVKVVDQPNSGASVARNVGLSKARGAYLSILDSDDKFEPNMLEKCYYFATSRHADLVVFGSNQFLDGSTAEIATPWTIKTDLLPDDICFSSRKIKNNAFRATIGWTWDKLFSRSLISSNKITFQEQAVYNDMCFTFSALVQAKRIAVIRDVLIHQRKRDSGSIQNSASSKWHLLYSALQELKNRLIRYNEYDYFERDYINYVLWMIVYHASICNQDELPFYLSDVLNRWVFDFDLKDKADDYFYSRADLSKLHELAFNFKRQIA